MRCRDVGRTVAEDTTVSWQPVAVVTTKRYRVGGR